MSMTKKQRFGLIVLIILIIATYLVTTEPWKKPSGKLKPAIGVETPPPNLTIRWNSLESGYPLAVTADNILRYTGYDFFANARIRRL